MGGTILSLLKELNGYKYIIAISVATVGSWYDIKGEIAELKSSAATLKEVAAMRSMAQLERDAKQEVALEHIHDELLAEVRLLRQELIAKHSKK